MTDFVLQPLVEELTTAPDVVILREVDSGEEVLELQTDNVLVEAGRPDVLIEGAPQTILLTEGVQGAPGPPGLDANEVAGALVEANRLSEYAGKSEAQQEVQQNIGLGMVDPLAYYILAKS